MKDSDLKVIVDTFNEALARIEIQDCAIQALCGQLDPQRGTAFAQDLRQRAAEAMQARAAHSTPAMDQAMTLQLAAILEAAGHAPPRPSIG